MAVETELGKALNLLRDSPDFALQHRDDGSCRVFNPAEITPDMGIVSLAGRLTFANGQEVPAVLELDARVNDIPRAVYVWACARWYEPAAPHDRAALLADLNLSDVDVFPYSWVTQISLKVG